MSDADFQRRYRADHPEVSTRNSKLAKARRRALNQLAALHPSEYVVLVDAECARVGIDPPGSRPTGRPPTGGQR
jgi:hypothetical protein